MSMQSGVNIVSPCAACKILRRRCAADKCVLAPYFPPAEPLKFAIAHRIFGASNIIKLLQELGEDERADAVTSMVYEANARVRDPVYGCTGAICHLHKQICELQAQLAMAHAQVLNMQCQNDHLFQLLISANHTTTTHQQHDDLPYHHILENSNSFHVDETILGVDNWEPLWTTL